MKYRKMGKWGAKLSCLGLGSYLNIGHKLSDEMSEEIVRTAYENGINFFDTADVYGIADSNGVKGRVEELLGRLLKDYRRSSLFVITKLFFDMGLWPNDRGLSAKHIKEGCEGSLKRLQMDYLDVLMCHRPDPDTPVEETVWAMEDLIRQGKILYWGVSEWTPEQISKAQSVARELNARPITINEPRYSLLYRQPEQGLFDVTSREGIGNVTFSPLGNGLLTGKYIPGQPAPEGTRASDPEINGFMMSTFYSEENKIKAQEFAKIAREMGATPSQLAIAWCLRRSEVTSVILGATKIEQLEDNLKACDMVITQDVVEILDRVFPGV